MIFIVAYFVSVPIFNFVDITFMTKHSLRNHIFMAIIAMVLIITCSCQITQQLSVTRTIKKSEILSDHFIGFCLYDPAEDTYLYQKNANLNFTPASNMKILTALTCLQTFGDSLPSFSYQESGDSLFIQPFGDPSFLNPIFQEQPVLSFLKTKSHLFIKNIETPLSAFGPGWAWDDFQYNFQPERSWFPIYGNMIRIAKRSDSLTVSPEFFKGYTQINYGEKPENYISRDLKYNLFNVWAENESSSFERDIPFDYSEELLIRLLADTLNREVMKTDRILRPGNMFYNQSTFNVVSYMMQASDNFLAEQLLIQAALRKGYDNIDQFRELKLQEWSSFNQNAIQWHDGSGLSRYNLITPLSLVNILNEIYKTESWATIKGIFPAGGQSGTLRNWYASDPPFIYAKTGTLSNNHNLSGYLITSSGKTLIFSLMNNNYVVPVSEVKKEMDFLLRKVRKMY